LRKKGVSRFDLRDPYHLAVALTWPQFLAALLALYLTVNVVFATLYWLVPSSVANARPNSFVDVFFFSIQTMATVSYGEMYPATLYGHAVAAIEIICGLAFTAIPRRREIECPRPARSARSDFAPLRVRRGESSVTTKTYKIHKTIRFPAFGRRLSRG